MRLSNNQKIAIALGLIIFGVISRFLPHPPNFAPIAALSIFGGAILPRRYALTLPLVAMIISDLIIGLHGLIIFTWGSFAFIAFGANRYLAKKLTFINVVSASVVASVFFYATTNFGVWLEGFLYPRTLDGLVDAYTMALPFFRNTLIGDLVYSGAFFGLYWLSLYVGSKILLRGALKTVHN